MFPQDGPARGVAEGAGASRSPAPFIVRLPLSPSVPCWGSVGFVATSAYVGLGSGLIPDHLVRVVRAAFARLILVASLRVPPVAVACGDSVFSLGAVSPARLPSSEFHLRVPSDRSQGVVVSPSPTWQRRATRAMRGLTAGPGCGSERAPSVPQWTSLVLGGLSWWADPTPWSRRVRLARLGGLGSPCPCGGSGRCVPRRRGSLGLHCVGSEFPFVASSTRSPRASGSEYSLEGSATRSARTSQVCGSSPAV